MRYQSLKQFIELTGMKQKRLAEILGVSEATVSLWLIGERKPSFPVAMRIKELMGIPLEQSLSGKL